MADASNNPNNLNDGHDFGPAIDAVIQVINGAANTVEQILRGYPILQDVAVSLAQDLRILPTRLAAITGFHANSPQDNHIQGLIDEMGPLKSVFGEPVNFRAPVVESKDLVIDETQRKAFIGRRDELRRSFLSRSDDQLLSVLHQPEGEALIRSIGKSVEYVGYKEAPVDVLFLQEIRTRLRAEQELNNRTALIELNKRPTFNDGEDELTEDLSGDPSTRTIPNFSLPTGTGNDPLFDGIRRETPAFINEQYGPDKTVNTDPPASTGPVQDITVSAEQLAKMADTNLGTSQANTQAPPPPETTVNIPGVTQAPDATVNTTTQQTGPDTTTEKLSEAIKQVTDTKAPEEQTKTQPSGRSKKA